MKNTLHIDPLLQCLVIITKLNNKPFTAESLIEGLPTEKGQAAPELFSLEKPKSGFSRAAKRAGFSSKLVKRNIKDISPLVLPCILILKDNKACILDEFDIEKKHAKIVLPDYEEGEIWVKVEDLNKEYLGHAFYLKKEYRQEDKEDFILENSNLIGFGELYGNQKDIY